jgi:hypothetical protein
VHVLLMVSRVALLQTDVDQVMALMEGSAGERFALAPVYEGLGGVSAFAWSWLSPCAHPASGSSLARQSEDRLPTTIHSRPARAAHRRRTQGRT